MGMYLHIASSSTFLLFFCLLPEWEQRAESQDSGNDTASLEQLVQKCDKEKPIHLLHCSRGREMVFFSLFSTGTRVEQSCCVRVSLTSGLLWDVEPGSWGAVGMEKASSGWKLLLANGPCPAGRAMCWALLQRMCSLELELPGAGVNKEISCQSGTSVSWGWAVECWCFDYSGERCLWCCFDWFRKAPGIIKCARGLWWLFDIPGPVLWPCSRLRDSRKKNPKPYLIFLKNYICFYIRVKLILKWKKTKWALTLFHLKMKIRF